MITSDRDPRDERFLLFLEEASAVGAPQVAIPDRIDRLARATRAVAEAVEVRCPPADLARWTIELAGWAMSPDPESLRPWALAALQRLRRDPVRARNVARGIVDWGLGQLRARSAELRISWQAVHDASLGYPIDPDAAVEHPARASAEVAAWSYALLRAAVARHARGLRPVPTTLLDAAKARKR